MAEYSYIIDSDDRNSYRIINQRGVRQSYLPSPTPHNACWDSILSPEGDVYLALCSELTTSEYAKLAKYDARRNEIIPLHYVKNYIFASERFIRDSKFHTNMAWMNDGRLVMFSYTTDRAPEHPAWMPVAYYSNPWEGYQGSSLLTYDPKTDTMENWGIPVHREAIYGAAYDSLHNVYYGIGYQRGHLYGVDLNDRSVKDYGQVTERASYRLVVGSDQNIYFTTRNGCLQRINVRTRQVEDLRIQLPYKKEEGRLRPYLTYGVNGPDGKLYIGGMHDEHLSCYDPATGEFVVVGEYMPAVQTAHGIPSNSYIGSMAFDKYNVLYYVICSLRSDLGEDYLVPAMLMRWDLFGQGKPEVLGLIGTKERVMAQSCTMQMDRERDQLYIVGTNHASDGPEVVAIDLAEYRDHALELGEPMTDPAMIKGNTCYLEHEAGVQYGNKVLSENVTVFSWGVPIAVPLYRYFENGDRDNAHVRQVSWQGDLLQVICGKDRFTRFTVNCDGEVVSMEPCETPSVEKLPVCDLDQMPYYPGRQYKRMAVQEALLTGGRRLLATADGMLAVESEGKTYAVGPAWINGAVHDMAVTGDGRKVYGVAGDAEDINMVFSYDDTEGLRWLGQVYFKDEQYGEQSFPELTAVAMKADDSVLAIGAGGRMGSVALYRC